MQKIRFIKDYTKEGYKKAICDACDDVKNRVDDILCDFEKHIRNIQITIDIDPGKLSIIITKEVAVLDDDDEGEENENN